MKTGLLAAFLLASSFSLNANALNIDMKPGLWEHKFKFDTTGASSVTNEQAAQMEKAMEEMKKQMANLPPEQKKMMEDMMAKQGIKISDKGIETAQGVHIGKDGTTVKVCITQEDINRGELPKSAENCDQKLTQVSSNSYKMTFECKGPHPSHGESDIVFQNSKSYSGKTTVTTDVNGKSQVIKGEQFGSWLASDCGDIKPYSAKAKAEK